ncbi:uracil-DNA glycosylase [Cytobacillus spongiae]|jgi:uracil-DNA glycosylase|uniref:uracil-DNA glycosylase n=1 Tax=Cytobacillus spongiae TaxID=2901381 RepID=UPI001F2505F8|nr:uracil-DNA glycosylase [Cytobacillus spongiae]UII55802.1 uracil-DNA glycosylase [Cytobacillus spongiae]
MLHFPLENDWKVRLSDELQKPYFLKLLAFLQEEYESQTVFPKPTDVFNALNYTPFEDVKVVLLGQDPYHGENQAHGLSFSVQKGEAIPPSLRNMYKELQDDLGCTPPAHGDLTKWARQGVLLLNTVLTVRKGSANSHKHVGWELFTDQIIRKLSDRKAPVIFLLWGNPAQQKGERIDSSKHTILTAPHPSPLAAYRGFFGSKPFSRVNEQLRIQGMKEIEWTIDNN